MLVFACWFFTDPVEYFANTVLCSCRVRGNKVVLLFSSVLPFQHKSIIHFKLYSMKHDLISDGELLSWVHSQWIP